MRKFGTYQQATRGKDSGDSPSGSGRAQYSRRCCQSCFPPCPGLTSPAGQAGPGAGLPRRFPSPCFPGSSCCWRQAASLPGGPVRKTCLDMAGSSGPLSALYSRRGAAGGRSSAGAPPSLRLSPDGPAQHPGEVEESGAAPSRGERGTLRKPWMDWLLP